MIKDLFFINSPYLFNGQFYIYPPTVKQVITNPLYNTYVKILTQSQEEIEDLFIKEDKTIKNFPTPLEFLLNNCYHSKEYASICKNAIKFFTHQEVTFLYDKKIILIGDLLDLLSQQQDKKEFNFLGLNADNFFEFQNVIREACYIKTVELPNPNEHPKIRAMKAKARYRDKIKAKQRSKNGINFFSLMAAICCMGIGITPLNIEQMSYVALEAIISVFQDKEKYQLDIDSLLAGGDSKKIKPKYWIKNLDI